LSRFFSPYVLMNFNRVNVGHGCHIPLQRKQGVKIHRSVKIRMEAEGLPGMKGKYIPKAKLKVDPIWID
jgi:hypothetical protein